MLQLLKAFHEVIVSSTKSKRPQVSLIAHLSLLSPLA